MSAERKTSWKRPLGVALTLGALGAAAVACGNSKDAHPGMAIYGVCSPDKAGAGNAMSRTQGGYGAYAAGSKLSSQIDLTDDSKLAIGVEFASEDGFLAKGGTDELTPKLSTQLKKSDNGEKDISFKSADGNTYSIVYKPKHDDVPAETDLTYTCPADSGSTAALYEPIVGPSQGTRP